jgi:hypothetical protein
LAAVHNFQESVPLLSKTQTTQQQRVPRDFQRMKTTHSCKE